MWCREVRDSDQLLFEHVILWYVLGCVGRTEVTDALWWNIKQSQVGPELQHALGTLGSETGSRNTGQAACVKEQLSALAGETGGRAGV